MTIKANFEQFMGAGARLGAYYVAITANGTISLYTGFIQKEALNKMKYATLFCDMNQGPLLGIRLHEQKPEEGGVALNFSKSGRNAWVASQNLFKYYGLNSRDYKGRYKPEHYEDEKLGPLYVINLKDNLDKK